MTQQSIKPQPPTDEGWVKELEVDLKTYCFKWNEANQEWRFRNAETYESFKDVLHYIGIVIRKVRQEAYAEGLKYGFDRGGEETAKEILAEVENLISAEMLICYKENTPTSRLTSLSNKLETLREKYDNSRTNY